MLGTVFKDWEDYLNVDWKFVGFPWYVRCLLTGHCGSVINLHNQLLSHFILKCSQVLMALCS